MANVVYATGGTGPFRPYVGWFDFTGVRVNPGTTVTFANTIPNIGVISMILSNEAISQNAMVGKLPIGVFNTTAYTGTGTNTCIGTGNTVTVTLDFLNINVTDFNGNPITTPWNIMVSDAEATALNPATGIAEYLQWTTNGSPWDQLAIIPANTTNNITGNGTQVLKNTGTALTNLGTPIAGTRFPTTLQLKLQADGGQNSAFGIFFDTIPISKAVSSNYAALGTVLTYTIPISNVSLNILNGINLVDTLPSNVSFMPGSLSINGIVDSNKTLPTVTLPDMIANGLTTVSFKVTVTSTVPNPIVNFAVLSGLQGTFPNSSISNSVTTTINYALLNTTKYVDKTNTSAGGTLTYTVVLSNSGNVTANSIILNDTVPTSTSYVAGSLTGATGTLPNVTVSNIGVGQTTTVVFKVLVGASPVSPIINNSTTTYSYIYNPVTSASIPSGTTSNSVSTLIQSANINTISKSVSEKFGTVGDTIQYTLVFTNTGNITATNVTLTDTIPNNTSFITNSLYVNNLQQIGLNPNPPGANLGNISPGEITTVTFNVNVTTLPTVNPINNLGTLFYTSAVNTTPVGVISNIVSTTINFAKLSSTKVVNKSYANIGDVLTYTIPIINSGNTTANNIIFLDTIPTGTSLVSGSFNQDGVAILGTPNVGTTLPSAVSGGGVTTVTFKVTVITLPVPNPIPNTATATSSFIIDLTTSPSRLGVASTNTNIVSTTVNFASLSGITKSVDKSFANCGDTITYTILAPNSGNVTALNVVFKDTIPNGTVLVPTSVFVNGVQQIGANPNTGVTIPNITPGAIATLTFSVMVQC